VARTRGFSDIRPSPRNQRLLKWLRRKPVPHTIVGETVDGEEHKAVVSLTGPTIWSDVLSVVRTCVHLEARDKDGNTLRALDIDSDDPELRAEDELEHAVTRASAAPGSVPIISVDIPRLVDNIARNIREASNEAARAQAGAFRDGFSAMTNVVNLCLNLLTRVDDRLAEVEQQNARNAPPEPAEPVDERKQLAMLAIQKAMGGGNGAPNGAGGMSMAQILQLVQQYQQGQPPAEGEQS
jgi:hypothetical protein